MRASVGAAGAVLVAAGRVVNEVVSFLVFTILDLLDMLLCIVYKSVDYVVEAERRPCYCSSAKEAIIGGGKILVSEQGESKIVRLCSTKVQLEDISDTLYERASLLSEVSKTVSELKRFKVERPPVRSGVRSTFTINSTIVEMLQGKIGGQQAHPIRRWSDCDCSACTSWTSSCKDNTLFVQAQGAHDKAREDVLFIHGFISSSEFWTETVFPNLSETTKSKYRLLAVDLLGFGKSPRPTDSLYTLREHVDMIERSVLEPYKVESFHIVAHSLGCILALAIAVKYPYAVKSLTLLAPPYFPVPKEEQGSQFVLRRLAPRRVWPPIAFGASIACWYEHISRTVCFLICKNHRVWEFIAKLVTRNRMKTFLLEGFFAHTHNAAWHTLHNIICGSANKMDSYLDTVSNELKCTVTVFHGSRDELLPVDCSRAFESKIPRADVKVIDKKDHITIVVGRQKAFARELEEIWEKASS